MRGIQSINRKNGFTLIETLIVIVVIGILSAIVYVSYKGVTHKAIESSLLSDLKNASSQLQIFKTTNKHYPKTIDCSAPDSSTNLCLRPSNGNTYSYTSNLKAKTFGLTASNGNDNSLSYRTNGAGVPIPCPVGYIIVPGSKTYSTSDFCVMKYEAKNIAGVATSVSYGTPWVSISQSSAITTSAAACTGCHLISEAEWMTIAQNVMGVASNWSNNTVGSDFIYSGHNDDNPSNAIVADIDDSNGYVNTNNTTGNQRRTLTLSNGEVIWDMAGNVLEWTSGQTLSGSVSQPGVSGNNFTSWVEWPTLNVTGSLAVNVTPAGTGLNGAGNWTSTNGIGKLMSNPTDTYRYGMVRGGRWNYSALAGVLSLDLSYSPSVVTTTTGFRVAR